MRSLISLVAFAVGLASVACNNNDGAVVISNTQNVNAARPAVTGAGPTTGAGAVNDAPLASAHRSSSIGSGGMTATSNDQPSIETPELDAKIEQADARAKASNASAADKLGAAAAYLERGNFYRDAGQPSLYKFALGDYRRALRYQPDNAQARERMEEIVSIYNNMGRPVPNNGNGP
ncbi:MAG: hypothetical protein M3R15_34955 [Acidobacteriota bacterium]|nr:hypothetical protein [Acidobacteriota bacterium]